MSPRNRPRTEGLQYESIRAAVATSSGHTPKLNPMKTEESFAKSYADNRKSNCQHVPPKPADSNRQRGSGSELTTLQARRYTRYLMSSGL